MLSLSGCGDGPIFFYTEFDTYGDEERVRVEVDGSMSKEDAETILEELQRLTGARERTVVRMAEPKGITWFSLAPVTNIHQLANMIEFGKVAAVTGNTIIVTMSGE